MEVHCVANLTVDGEYVNGVTVLPLPGLRFGFRPQDGVNLVTGVYDITGQLEQRQGVSNKGGEAKAYNVLQVTGTAKRVQFNVSAFKA